jgi:hypothetical protein
MKNLKEIGYPHYAATVDGRIYSLYSHKFLSDKKMLGEYKAVTICENGERKEETVHRLIAKAFIPNPDNLPVVNHKDGDKTNNCVTNLEWCTQKENVRHAMETGLRKKEVINDYRSIPDEVVMQICILLEQGSRNKDICEMFGVTSTCVSGIKSGKFYKDISNNFNFRAIPSSNRISETKVICICEMLQKKESINKIRLSYGVAFSVVKNIKDRKTYTYISNNYNW